MSNKSAKQSTKAAQKKEQQEKAKEIRQERAQERSEERQERQAPVREARKIRNDSIREQVKADRMKQVDLATAAEEEEEARTPKPKMLSGKPGSGAGLKPGDWFAPASNPGAAARVPNQPLQPESLQSHGKGIIYDKDLDNPPYGQDDPTDIDEGPSGSNPRAIDKEMERDKAEKMTAKAKQKDPDNTTIGYKGADATASPNPIGSTHRSKTNVSGGSNSGSEV